MILDVGDQITVLSGWIVALSMLAIVGGLITDRPWKNGRHTDYDHALKLPPAGTMARFAAGEDGGAARVAGPGGAPDTVRIGAPDTVVIEPTTPRPYAIETGPMFLEDLLDEHGAPPLVVDSPPGALGTLPSGDLGVPIVRRYACGLCHDGKDVIGAECIWCGSTARSAS